MHRPLPRYRDNFAREARSTTSGRLLRQDTAILRSLEKVYREYGVCWKSRGACRAHFLPQVYDVLRSTEHGITSDFKTSRHYLAGLFPIHVAGVARARHMTHALSIRGGDWFGNHGK